MVGIKFFKRILNKPSLLTNAFIKSEKARYKGWCYSAHFSWSCLTEKIMTIVDLPDLKTHYDSEQTCSANICILESTTLAKPFLLCAAGTFRGNCCSHFGRHYFLKASRSLHLSLEEPPLPSRRGALAHGRVEAELVSLL